MNRLNVLNTSGDGDWSTVSKEVIITEVECKTTYKNNKADFCFDKAESEGELFVYFDSMSWNNDEDGLIYTDKQFLLELKEYFREYFKSSNYSANDIEYSEHGMQGNDFVSFKFGPEFIENIVRTRFTS